MDDEWESKRGLAGCKGRRWRDITPYLLHEVGGQLLGVKELMGQGSMAEIPTGPHGRNPEQSKESHSLKLVILHRSDSIRGPPPSALDSLGAGADGYVWVQLGADEAGDGQEDWGTCEHEVTCVRGPSWPGRQKKVKTNRHRTRTNRKAKIQYISIF